METFYKVLYSLAINWRSFAMIFDENMLKIFGIKKETVSVLFKYLS